MYKEFYLMRREPFDSHPSPELFYKSNVHQTAWHYLVQGIKQQEPILVLAGDYGAGKTLLFLKLVRLLNKNGRTPFVSVPTPTYNYVMILEKIVETLLNISPGNINTADESKLQQAIYEYFENTDTKAPIYVIIDDAQEFSYSFINKLRLFASYNCGGFFPIRLVFFAHYSFLKMLTYKKLVALGQRIKRIYHLKPLNYEEAKEYIYFRLIHSGATGTPVFDDDAIRVIHAVSKGNPRLINNVCDNCLLLAGDERINLIDAGLVHNAMEIGQLPGVESIDVPPPTAVNRESVPGDYQAAQENMHRSNVFPGAGPDNYPGSEQSSLAVSERVPRVDPRPEVNPLPDAPPTTYSGEYPLPSQEPQYGISQNSGGSDATYDRGREDASNVLEKFWSRYGKIGIIVFLLLIIFFLASYVFGSGLVNPVGVVQNSGSRIIREISYRQHTILKAIPEQLGDMDADGQTNLVPENREADVQGEANKTYQPVLLTESFGS